MITIENVRYLINSSGHGYLRPGASMIIVNELSEDSIMNALNDYCEGDAYWIKEYHLSGTFDIETLDSILKEKRKE